MRVPPPIGRGPAQAFRDAQDRSYWDLRRRFIRESAVDECHPFDYSFEVLRKYAQQWEEL